MLLRRFKIIGQALIQSSMVIEVSQRPLWCHAKLFCELVECTGPLLYQEGMYQLIIRITKLTNLNLVKLQLRHLIFKLSNPQNATFVKHQLILLYVLKSSYFGDVTCMLLVNVVLNL